MSTLHVYPPSLAAIRPLRRLLTLALLAAFIASLASPAAIAQAPSIPPSISQPKKDDVPQATPRFEIDIDTLFHMKEPFTGKHRQGLWEFTPMPQRRLFHLPLEIYPADGAYTVSTNTIKLSRARLIAFRLYEPPRDPEAQILESQFPVGAPATTRRFDITKEGEVAWDMERVIAGGSVPESDSLYVKKIRRELLMKSDPGNPPVIKKNKDEKPLDFRRRLIDARNAYREKKVAFAKLLREVNALPDDFRKPMPVRIWCVFDLLEREDELDITMPAQGGGDKSWTIKIDHFNKLRSYLSPLQQPRAPKEGPTPLPDGAKDRAKLAAEITQATNHPYTLRAVAMMITESKLDDYLGHKDLPGISEAAAVIIKGQDAKARNMMIASALEHITRPGAMELLRLTPLNPTQQIALLKALLSNPQTISDREEVTKLVDQVALTLTDADGPAVDEVLPVLSETGGRMSGLNYEVFQKLLWSRVDLSKMPEARRDALLLYVINGATTNRFWSDWLDKKLLGGDEAVALRTLQMLVSAMPPVKAEKKEPREAEGKPLATHTESSVDINTRRTPQFNPEPIAEPLVPSDLRPQLAQPINLPNIDHSYFKLLDSESEKLGPLAWQAIRWFAFGEHQEIAVAVEGEATAEGEAKPAPQPKGDQRWKTLIELVHEHKPPAEPVISFLLAQKNEDASNGVMIKLALTRDKQYAKPFIDKLKGSQRKLGAVLATMPPVDRRTFAARMYESRGEEAPLVINLLIDERATTLASWFGGKVAEGSLPDVSQWVAQAGGEEELLRKVASSDPNIARAAAVALLLSVGESPAKAPLIVRDLGSKDLKDDDRKNRWDEHKRKVHARTVAKHAGPLRAVLIVYTPKATTDEERPADSTAADDKDRELGELIDKSKIKAAGDDPDKLSREEYPLGVLTLKVDEDKPSFANAKLPVSISAQRIALVLDTPNALKDLNAEATKSLPLDKLRKPIELVLQEDKSWKGTFELTDGRKAELMLTPEKD